MALAVDEAPPPTRQGCAGLERDLTLRLPPPADAGAAIESPLSSAASSWDGEPALFDHGGMLQ
eukprot:15447987-Alexandrium_andersonii.AAC.1